MIALYPGSFNPWHDGHQWVKDEAEKIFKKVDVIKFGENGFTSTLAEYIADKPYVAIIRGLRNGIDFEYEKSAKYWYEDTGVKIPIIHFICPRHLCHVSSTVIRSMKK